MSLPTVQEIWRLALPSGTSLVNSAGDLHREVVWARRMALHPPVFASLEAGEIALVPVNELRFVDDRLTLAKLVTSLGERGAAAVAVEGAVGEAASREADNNGLCLLRLPSDTDLRVTEKDTLRLILDREAQLDRRGRELYRQMAQHTIGQEGLPAIADALQRVTRKSVTILSPDFAQLVTAQESRERASSYIDLSWLADSETVQGWLTRDELDSRSPPGAILSADETSPSLCVSAIVGDGQLSGFVVVFDETAAPDALDRLATERAALVCAVEMAKQQAVSAAEERVRGDFLDMLLTSGVSESTTVARRASEMGYPLEGQHTVMLIDLGAGATRLHDTVNRQVQAQLNAANVPALIGTYGHALAVLCRADNRTLQEMIETQAGRIGDRTTSPAPRADIAIGIGGRGEGITGIRRSFHQAQETVTLARELFDSGGVLTYGDLPLYHLLKRLQDCEEWDSFHEQTLGALEAYDRDHDAELVTTLAAYFVQFGNVTQTAESLHLHRNSLMYRLERIQDVTGFNLDDDEDRFALQLALKLRSIAVC